MIRLELRLLKSSVVEFVALIGATSGRNYNVAPIPSRITGAMRGAKIYIGDAEVLRSVTPPINIRMIIKQYGHLPQHVKSSYYEGKRPPISG